MRTISVTSGKGGVGKTTVVANLALALAAAKENVLIFDGDFGLASVDIFFNAKPNGHFSDILTGRKTINEVITEIAPKIFLLPAGSALPDFVNMNNFQRRALLDAIGGISQRFDWMLIDTAPGISENVLYLNSACNTNALVLTPDPASFADAYALIKMMNVRHRSSKFSIICNQVRDEREGLGLFQRFSEATLKFLDVGLDYLGSIPLDQQMRKATQMQQLVLQHDPVAPSAAALRRLSAEVRRQASSTEVQDGLRGFWNQVVGVA